MDNYFIVRYYLLTERSFADITMSMSILSALILDSIAFFFLIPTLTIIIHNQLLDLLVNSRKYVLSF